jgi:hypothetical protein
VATRANRHANGGRNEGNQSQYQRRFWRDIEAHEIDPRDRVEVHPMIVDECGVRRMSFVSYDPLAGDLVKG